MSTYIMRRIIKEWFHGRADALCQQRTTWGLARLERRVMLAADGAVAAGEPICQAMELCDAVDVAPMLVETSMHAIVFIDSSVPDMGVVTAELPADSEWIVLDPHGDGLQQITSVLARRTQVTAVHVVAHGESGKIRLGNRTVDEAALREMQDGLRGWAKSLTSDADILLYGCETGAGSVGARFVKVWSELTGADVAASTNRTGASRHGGDWALEQVAGNIETPVVVSAVLQSKYNHVLATQLYVYAAGQTGEEQITIWVNDTPYATRAIAR